MLTFHLFLLVVAVMVAVGLGAAGCLVDVLMASSDVSKRRCRGKCWRREGFHYTNMGILGLFFAAVIVSELNKSTQMV